jgi:PAS domain S-box-containing protein
VAEARKLRALVVEDEPDMARQLARVLENKFGLEVETAYDCATAREKISAGRFDVLTLDFMLPDGRGLDFLEEIASTDSGPRVIMVTGHGDEETAVRSFRSSASGYVVKDAHLRSRLIEAVEKALMEIELRAAELELRRREEQFRSLIEKASDLITMIDPDGIITYESPSVERILGYTPDEMVGRSAFDFIHPDDLPRIMGIIGRSLSVPGATAIAEYRFSHKDGPWRIMESVGRNLLDDPAVEGLVINSRDVTERKRNEERLRRYREELEQLVQERTAQLAETNVQLQQEIGERTQAEEELKERAERLADFLTVASHELRHPVSVVKGYATMLTGYLERMEPEDLHTILDALDVSVDRLTGHIEKLMEVSQVEQGRLAFEKSQYEVAPLVQTAMSDMRARGLANEVTANISDDAGLVYADSEKFLELLVILLDNASKFSPPSCPIEIEVERSADAVVVSVLDRGIGVPEEARELIFDRFYQVEEVKHHSSVGLGLGLYLAKQIVLAHHGNIQHIPREGGGSIFRFSISSLLESE